MTRVSNMRLAVSTSARAIFALAFLCCCSRAAGEAGRVEIAMGTRVEIRAGGGGQAEMEHAIDAAFSSLREVEKGMSRYDPGSELSMINASAGKGEIAVSGQMAELLALCDTLHKSTGGVFDPTVGPAMELWSNTPPLPPSEEAISLLKGKTGWSLLKFFPDKKALIIPAGMRIDLDGIAKGYGADRALEALRRSGATYGMVNAGGDIACYSANWSKTWKIGIADPSDREAKPLVVVQIQNGALATSGGAERYWEIGGKRYPKILDPQTLSPPPNPPASASAYARTAAEADAWATAAVILGDKAIYVGGNDSPALAVFYAGGRMVFNDRWRSLFGPPASP